MHKKTPQIFERIVHKNGKLVYTESFIEGNPQERIIEEYHSNGNIKQRKQFTKGVIKTGTWKSYYPDGNIQLKGSYIYDKPNGIWKSFNEEGKLISKQKYRKGEKIQNK